MANVSSTSPTMSLSQTPSLTNSPKRKRGYDSPSYSPVVSPALPRITTNVPEFHSVDGGVGGKEKEGNSSPQNVVAHRLQDLRIHSSRLERTAAGLAQKRTALTGLDINQTSSSSHGLHDSMETHMSNTTDDIMPPSSSTFQFEANNISDLMPEVSRKPGRSPPIDGAPQENFWHESEITGYDPTDPNDDGYGINGIGFRPTASAAWARSQRRKQQLADYKSREAREARQKRSERRKVASFEESINQDDPGEVSKKPTRVRFDAG